MILPPCPVRRAPRPVSRAARSAVLGLVLATAAPGVARARAQVPEAGTPSTERTLLARADSFLESRDLHASLGLLDPRLARDPDDLAARWRAARAAVYSGILAKGERAQNEWYRKGMAYADRVLGLHPDDPHALRWALAARGSLAEQTGARERVALAKDVSRLAHHILELDPDDAFAHDALGTLDYRIMRLSSFERTLGRLFLGGDLLARASWRDALAYHREAVALDPDNILYRVDLANTLAGTGHMDEAIAQLRVAVSLPRLLPVDAHFHVLAERRLGELHRREEERSPKR